jgi:peptidase E
MPFVSKAQQGYFETHKKQLEDQGVSVSEWEQASKGQHDLPEHVNKGKPWHSKT